MIHIAELAPLAAAAYWGTYLAVHAELTDPLRAPVYAWHERRPESALRAKLVTLIACTYCAGWWISGALLATYLLATGQWHSAPLPVHGVEWAAVAGGQALLNRWDDTRQTETA